ncbi:MAG: hypothetical protein HC804_03225 [Anaerolineae bacterium]|nr:hypothetical protein [Anaerolineae bacterium]
MFSRHLILLLLCLIIAFIGISTAAAHNFENEDTEVHFLSLSYELVLMEEFFHGGNGELVVFDAVTSQEKGYSEEAVNLAEELAAHTNALVLAANDALGDSKSVNTELSTISLEQFPAVKAYFAAATDFNKNNESYGPEGWCSPQLSDIACSCGHWSFPRPFSAANWQQWYSSNPVASLTSLGYHETANLFGGGWTRPQTYYPSRCGYNTFRDHALIVGSTTVREQNYAGFTPRGEPNPEVLTSGPWPYLTWPSYVQWWHENY